MTKSHGFVPRARPRRAAQPRTKRPGCYPLDLSDPAHDIVEVSPTMVPPHPMVRCRECAREGFAMAGSPLARRMGLEPSGSPGEGSGGPGAPGSPGEGPGSLPGLAMSPPGAFLDEGVHPDIRATLDALRDRLPPGATLPTYRVRAIEARIMRDLGERHLRVEAMRDYWDMWTREYPHE